MVVRYRPLGPALYPWSLPSLPARSPHVSVALFLAAIALVLPPLGSIAWWYARTELARIAAGELWPHGQRWLVLAKGCGVVATTACATFLVLAAATRWL
jgi:hypothetical protein